MKNKKKIALALMLCSLFLVIAGTMAIFTDRAQGTTSAKAGNLDLVLSAIPGVVDSLNNNEEVTDAATSWIIANDKYDSVNKASGRDGVIDPLYPGSVIEMDYVLSNAGNKSIDTRETYLITSENHVFSDDPELLMYKASDVYKNEDTGAYEPIDGATPITYTLDDDKKVMTIKPDTFVLNGTGDYAETESDALNNSHTSTWEYVILFAADADSSWMGNSLTVEYLAEAKQHRNTGGKDEWTTVESIMTEITLPAGSVVEAVPGENDTQSGSSGDSGGTDDDTGSDDTPSVYTYTVAFDANGGSGSMSSQAFTYGTAQNLTANSFTKTGYTFAGWAETADGTVKYTDGQSVSNLTGTSNGTVTLYAVWKANSYTVSFDANGGSGSMSNQTHTYGSSLALTANSFTKTGYTFKGWTTSSTATSATYTDKQSVSNLTSTAGGTVTLYAVWSVNSYTYDVVYESSSGTQLGTTTVANNFGTTATVDPKAFEGYTSPASQEVTWDSKSAKTITFTYTPIEYTISYTLNGGTVSSANKTSYTVETETFTLNNPAKTGYTFNGWTGSNGTTASTSVSIAKGSTGNKSYTANFTANSYTISFNANGGSGSMSSQAFTYGTAQNLTANSFTKEGYTFAGWATEANGEKVYDDKASVYNLTDVDGKSITLYAVWTQNIISFTFEIRQYSTYTTYTVTSTETFYAEEGMTWEEFIESDYNTDQYFYHLSSSATSGDCVYTQDSATYCVYMTSSSVNSLTISYLAKIEADVTYFLAFENHGGGSAD